MNLNVVKLWKQMLQLAEIETDKAKLIVESEVAEGVEVFVEQDGEYVPAEDGEYETEDKIIVVAEGKIAEIRDKEVEETEQEPEEAEQEVEVNLAKQKYDAVKAQFEASYQEVEANIYSALADSGSYGYLIENGDDYAIVSEWGADEREHLYRYEISIGEDGFVTLGTKKEVRIEYVDVEAEPEVETEVDVEMSIDPEKDEKDAKIAELETKVAELESAVAEKQAQLEMSADEPAKDKVKKEVKSGALKYFG